MLNTAKTLAFAGLTALSLGVAHAGSISDDINNCRAAMDEASLFGDAEYTLDFVKDYGNRNRVLTLKANIVGADEAVVECRMKRTAVVDVVIAEEA